MEMPSSAPQLTAFFSAVLAFGAVQGVAGAGKDAEAGYLSLAEPLLAKYCFDCHSDGVDEGGLDFYAYGSDAALLDDHELWEKIDLHVRSHSMPPADKPAPSLEERNRLRRWIDEAVFWVDPDRPDPGPAIVRKLTRAEYNRTVRDLFQINASPADQFPPDDASHGYDTAGASLRLSSLLLEKHLRAARQVADEATRILPVAQSGDVGHGRGIDTYAGEPERQSRIVILHDPKQEVGLKMRLPVRALYKVTVHAAATRPEGAPEEARYQVLHKGKPLREFVTRHEFTGKRRYWSPDSMLVELDRGVHWFSVKTLEEGRSLAIHTIEIQGPCSPVEPRRSAFLRDLLPPDRSLAVPVLQLSGEDLDQGKGHSNPDTGKAWFASEGYRHTAIALVEDGRYRFRVKAGAQQAGDELARLGIQLGDRKLGDLEVTAPSQRAEWLELEADVEAGEHPLQIWFRNDLLDAEGEPERVLWVHELRVEGPLDPATGLRAEELPDVLERIGLRVFRRPLSEAESSRLSRLVATADDPMEGLRLGIEAMLASPKFLTLNSDLKPAGPAEAGSAPIDEFSLATRLSYFLWSSAPDARLLELAQRGELRTNLREEVLRMLDDPKARALTDHFAGQWLQLRDLANKTPDPGTFRRFDPILLEAMQEETERFFERILKENRPVMEFLTGDSNAFVKPELAKHYGSRPRKGILSQGSFLVLTSHPDRTSPVNRGVFLLEKLLGLEPPPAPAAVPPLEDSAAPEGTPQTLRAQLEVHRSNKSCAACHAFLDPPGLALENFDATGRWRESDRGQAIDASGSFVTGETFSTFDEMQALLVELHGEDFVANLTRQLMTYALGRGVTFRDKLAVRDILAQTEANGHPFRDLILAICESVPFQRMRVDS